MLFLYSLKLFGSNWVKALKFFLYYVVIWGVCLVLLLPVIFEFQDVVVSNFQNANVLDAFAGVFKGSLGMGIYNIIHTSFATCQQVFEANVGLMIYGLIVLFIILPFLINIGKYAFCEMLYSYMTSKNKVGFFSALVKGLRKSLGFALCKTLYNLLFFAVTISAIYGVGTIENTFFITYFLPLVEFVILVVFFTLHELTVLGWMPALIVFDCNVFSAFRKGFKAVRRHLLSTFATTALYFFLFWLLILIFGVYTMIALVPLMTIMLCVFNMTMFFSSQGMRFYYNDVNILTPKKLEEVDNINKTAYIL